jgi:DNA repair exonuclease SbcCD nuclease subunit
MEIKKIKGKRVWFISDTHLGVRNNSNDWIELIRDYFFNWFFPLVRSHYKEGDILIHLGDYFDSRQSLNLKVLNLGIEIAEEISKIFEDGTYIIAGNHDIWGKTSNDVNSLKCLKWIPNINVIEEPQSFLISGRSFFFMPWRKDHSTEEKTLESSDPHDVLCCHTDIRGLKFNRYVKIEEGSDISKFSKFNKVYSGHIHYSQRSGNINMVGSPYQITRSDINNPKFITLLDLNAMEEEIFYNEHSPKFKKINFKDLLDYTLEEANSFFSNNFVDVMIDPSISLGNYLSALTDLITSQRTLNFQLYDPNNVSSLQEQILDSDGSHFNVMDFIKEYINKTEDDDSIKQKMILSFKKLHSLVSKNHEDPDNL